MNPFPGLRSFDTEESHLFFGRETQIDTLLQRLAKNEFIGVVGTSGCGKSSLVRAGVLPVLYGGFMTDVGSSWRVVVLRPGHRPIHQLATALNAVDAFGPSEQEDRPLQIAITEAILTRGARGLVEVVAQARMPQDENLLIFIDQFEEVFRFKHEASTAAASDEAAAFVKLLLEAIEQEEYPIHVLITMRSDYLGDCAEFRDLPERLNDSQYLVPRMTRAQLADAIKGPIAVGEGCITPALVNRMLNEIGDNQDQLPVLQHALMRTWDYWEQHRSESEPIDFHHYEAVGGMKHSLSRHANEIFAELEPHQRLIAEVLFKRLTDRGDDNRGVRRMASLAEVSAVAEASPEDVAVVVDQFRLPGRTFLMPPSEVPLEAATMLDISHESLMRNWDKLRDWVEEEAACARRFRRLAETTAQNLQGKHGFLGNPELAVNETWLLRCRTNSAWADRYRGESQADYGQTIEFLQRSIAERDAQIAAEEEHRRLDLRRKNRQIRGFFASTMLFAGISLIALDNYRRAMQAELKGLIDSATRFEELGETEGAVADLLKAGSHLQCPQILRKVPLVSQQVCTLGPLWNRMIWPQGPANVLTFGENQTRFFKPGDRFLDGMAKRVYSLSMRLPGLAPVQGETGQASSPAVSAISFSDDGEFLYAVDVSGQRLYRWNLSTSQASESAPRTWRAVERWSDSRNPGPPRSLVISPDQRFAVVTTLLGDATLWILSTDAAAKKQAITIPSRGGWLSEAAFAPADSSLLVLQGADEGFAQLWRISADGTPRQEAQQRISAFPLVTFAFAPSEPTRLVTTDDAGTVYLWDVRSARVRPLPGGRHGRGTAARFTPSGEHILVAGPPKVAESGGNEILFSFHDVTGGEALPAPSQQRLAIQGNGPGSTVVSEIFFPFPGDEQVFATSSLFDSTLRIWRLEPTSGEVRKTCVLLGDSNRGWADLHLRVSSDPDQPCRLRFASITSSRIVRLWQGSSDPRGIRLSLGMDSPGEQDPLKGLTPEDRRINALMQRGCELMEPYLSQEQKGDLKERLRSLHACPTDGAG